MVLILSRGNPRGHTNNKSKAHIMCSSYETENRGGINSCSGTVILLLVTGCLGGFGTYDAVADEDDAAVMQRYTPTGRHRLDFTYSNYETLVGDVDTFIPTYTWAPRRNLRFSLSGSWIANNIDGGTPSNPDDDIKESGHGDLVFGIQYDPNERLTASPWVPDTVGLNAQILAPTGDAEKGLSLDAWYASIGAGWAIDSIGHLWLVPAVGYDFTFGEDDLAVPVDQAYASLDFAWVFQFGAWVGVSPRISRDFELDEWVDEYVITVGKMFQNGFGISFDIGRIERLDPAATGSDRTWLINFYYQFGMPPDS